MNGNFLLDTSIIVAIFSGDDSVPKRLEQSGETFIPSIAVGELYFGAYKSGRIVENLTQIRKFITESTILDCDVNTAHEYGLVKNQLRGKGQLISENDIWIAAIALQYSLILVTSDRHFDRIDGLKLEIFRDKILNNSD